MVPSQGERLREAVDADRAVFRAIYPTLRRFAAVVAPAGIEPDDLVQEALARVLKRVALSELAEPQAYLRQTVLNLARDEGRRGRRLRERRHLLVEAEHYEQPLASDLADLSRLAPLERAAVFLVDVEGYDMASAAVLMGCNEAAARKRLSRARRRLSAELRGEL